jgi:cell division protein FtsB
MGYLSNQCAELLLSIQKHGKELDAFCKENMALKKEIAELRIEIDKLQSETENPE